MTEFLDGPPESIDELLATGASRVVIPINGKYALWGLSFYLNPYDDMVRCCMCGRRLQWPDAAQEHARYHDALVHLSWWEHVKWWWKKR